LYFILDPRMANDYELMMFSQKPSAGFSVELYFGDGEGDRSNPHLQLAPDSHTIVGMVPEKRRFVSRGMRTGIEYVPRKMPDCVELPEYKYLSYGKFTIFAITITNGACN
jgi:hypothetical protein